MKIAVIYFSQTETTHALCEILQHRLEQLDVKVLSHRIKGEEIEDGRFVNPELFTKLLDVDAMVFASPTYMGNASAQFKAFADASSEQWGDQLWAGKFAAGITCGSAPNGDQSFTLQYFMTLANQHGMFWIGLDSAYGYLDRGVNRLGSQSGVVAVRDEDEIHDKDAATVQYLGERIVDVLRSQKPKAMISNQE